MNEERRKHISAGGLAVALVGALYIAMACGGGQQAPELPEGQAPSSSGCSKDTDCKGERICQEGKCITPR